MGDSWMPASDGEWQDYYHGEFRGFAEVDITSPAGDLTVQHYASTLGWFTNQDYAHNYTAGASSGEEIYQGGSASGPLLAQTQNIYAGYSGQFFNETRTFDQAGNLVSQATTLAAVNGGSSTGGSETANYCYNAQNELLWASNTQTPQPSGGQVCGSATPGTTITGSSYTNSFVYTHLGQLWQGPQSQRLEPAVPLL